MRLAMDLWLMLRPIAIGFTVLIVAATAIIVWRRDAFVLDPDGHNIEAVCRAPQE